MVDQLNSRGKLRVVPDRLLQPFHASHTGIVIVKAQADLRNVWVVVEELKHGTGRCAAEGEVGILAPVTAASFYQRRQRERVNRAFCHGNLVTVCVGSGQAEVIPLVAALHVQLEVVPRSSQTGEACDTLRIFADENTVLILLALVQDARVHAGGDDLSVYAPSLKIGHHIRREKGSFGKRERLSRLRLWTLRFGRRAVAAERFHSADK